MNPTVDAKHKVFLTKDNTILIVRVEIARDRLTITADEIRPLEYDEAVRRNREYLEDGELWRECVQAGNTTQGLEEWIDDVTADDDIGMIDTSLYPNQIDIDGTEYVFESDGCGCLHDEILAVWAEAKIFVDNHLKSPRFTALMLFDELRSDDVDARVEELARVIV